MSSAPPSDSQAHQAESTPSTNAATDVSPPAPIGQTSTAPVATKAGLSPTSSNASSAALPTAPPTSPAAPTPVPASNVNHEEPAPSKSEPTQGGPVTPAPALVIPRSTGGTAAEPLPTTPAPTVVPTTAPAAAPSLASAPATLSIERTTDPLKSKLTPAQSAPQTTPALQVPEAIASTRASPIRSPSSSSVRRLVENIDSKNDSEVQPRSRRNSESTSEPARADKPRGLVLPARPVYGRAASSQDLRSGLASPVIPKGAVESLVASVHTDRRSTPGPAPLAVISLFTGVTLKKFEVHRHVLVSKSGYFARLFEQHTDKNGVETSEPNVEDLTFADIDEFAMALFVRWAYGGKLHGPKDTHSFGHYLSLYVLARRIGSEPLQNDVMDLTRAYYRQNSMTAPAYRLEYIYRMTTEPNPMRDFLVTTAAYRCLCEAPIAPGVHVSDSMRTVIVKGDDAAVEFPEALIKLSKNGIVDVRRSADCTFHAHSDGQICAQAIMEPYMTD